MLALSFEGYSEWMKYYILNNNCLQGRVGGPPHEGSRFDCVFVDVFDGANVLPPGFYDDVYLRGLRDRVLAPGGIIVHNLHEGTDELAVQMDEASAAYSRTFCACHRVASLDSGSRGGNTILLASTRPLLGGRGDRSSALEAQLRWGLRFDAAARVEGALRFASL